MVPGVVSTYYRPKPSRARHTDRRLSATHSPAELGHKDKDTKTKTPTIILHLDRDRVGL
jgi:hypothetical protein